MLGFNQEKGIVGLDIGSHSIKAVELSVKKKKDRDVFEVTKIGHELLPHDAIVEGTIIDSTAVVETIKMIFDENKFKNRNVIISISGNSVIIKKISLPAMDKEELAESIVWEAKHNIPYPYEETNVDYAILRPPRGSEDKNLDILLVAAKKDKIANYSNVVNQARKNLVAIDVDVFALQNSVEVNYPETFQSRIVAMINIGANITNIAIIERGTSQLFRDLSLGGFFFIENMRKELNISFDDAEKLLKGLPMKTIPPEKVDEVIALNIKDLLDEIAKTFSFYEAGEKREKKIEQIYLSGGLAHLKNIANSFEQKFNIKAEIINPFRNVRYDEKKLDPVYSQEMAALFGVAVGLATRKVEKQK
jgi:type IV pilus assembly protein PilM